MNILLRKRIYISVRPTAFDSEPLTLYVLAASPSALQLVLVIVTVVNEAALLCNERDPERIRRGSHGKDPHSTRR
jgi:hypothetical protein